MWNKDSASTSGSQGDRQYPALQRGFSLLEVLVAFVVAGLVVGMLLQLLGSTLRNMALAEAYSLASQVAESRLAAVGSEIPVSSDTVSGVDSGSGYHWQVVMQAVPADETVEKLEKMALALYLYRVEVTVTWEEGDKPHVFRLASLRFGEKP